MQRIYTHNDLTGRQFGNWKVLSLAEGRYKHGGMMWLCECQCAEKTLKHKSSNSLVSAKRGLSCGCQAQNRLRPYEALYNRLRYDNKWSRRARKVLFTYEEFLSFTKISQCHYCGTGIAWTKFNLLNGSAYHLDRKDNSLPYTLGNCVVCCERCNKSKREWFSYEEWYGMTEYLRSKGINEDSLSDRSRRTDTHGPISSREIRHEAVEQTT